jgi:hypothetical protein
MKNYLHRLSDEALEMVMRDVLDGLQELALERALISDICACRIISIENSRKAVPDEPVTKPAIHGQVMDFQQYRARRLG